MVLLWSLNEYFQQFRHQELDFNIQAPPQVEEENELEDSDLEEVYFDIWESDSGYEEGPEEYY